MTQKTPPTRNQLSQGFRQRYVSHDYLYGVYEQPISLFLPPSRLTLGVLAAGLPEQRPLELAPVEYMAAVFESGEFAYLRPDGGFEGRVAWSFPDNGEASYQASWPPFEVEMRFKPFEAGNGLTITCLVRNSGREGVKALYVNPCLRYQNLAAFRSAEHESLYLHGDAGPISLGEIAGAMGAGPRFLALQADCRPEDPSLAGLVESLMASRFMSLSQGDRVTGNTIICLDEAGERGICFGWEKVLGFFSRSEADSAESGCLHAIPLIKDLPSGREASVHGALTWGGGGLSGLRKSWRGAMGRALR